MNHDDRVDDLLKDLDLALSIEPSPAVAARVREKISTARAATWTFWSWRFVAAGAVTAFIVLVSYATWPRVSVPATPAPKSVAVLDPEPKAAEPAAPVTREGSRRAHTVGPDTTVLVPASYRLALEQFTAAVRVGEVTEDSFSRETIRAPEEKIPIERVSVDVIAAEKVVIDLVPSTKTVNPPVR